MQSVFSNHFIECHYNYLVGTQPQRRDKIETPTVSEAFDAWIQRPDLKDCHWCPQLFMSLNPEADIADNNIFNLICTNNQIKKVEQWATKNILLCVRTDWRIKTRHVKFRIVAGMLNKLVNKCITQDDNIYMFNNMVINMHDLDRDLMLADLPF